MEGSGKKKQYRNLTYNYTHFKSKYYFNNQLVQNSRATQTAKISKIPLQETIADDGIGMASIFQPNLRITSISAARTKVHIHENPPILTLGSLV